MATPKPETVTDLVQQLSRSAIPTSEPRPSPELGVIITRVDAFLAAPLPTGSATEIRRIVKDRREKAVAEVAKLLPVQDEESFAQAGRLAQECANIRADIARDWLEVKTNAHRAHEAICNRENRELAPKEIVQEACTENMRQFRIAQDRERQRLEREAAQKAEAERQRLAREAADAERERVRLENEARELRRQGDVRQAKEVAAQAAVAKEEAKVATEEAAAVVEQAVYIPSAKAEGIGEKRAWTGVCFDPRMLILAVANGTFPLEHLTPQRGGPDKMVPILEVNQAVLDHYAKRLQDTMNVPGCRAEQGFSLSVRKG